jgi:rubrerythrin
MSRCGRIKEAFYDEEEAAKMYDALTEKAQSWRERRTLAKIAKDERRHQKKLGKMNAKCDLEE